MTVPTTITCPYCNDVCRTNSYNKHLLTLHKDDILKYKENIDRLDGYSFQYVKLLLAHNDVKTHRYFCFGCDASYAVKGRMVAHIQKYKNHNKHHIAVCKELLEYSKTLDINTIETHYNDDEVNDIVSNSSKTKELIAQNEKLKEQLKEAEKKIKKLEKAKEALEIDVSVRYNFQKVLSNKYPANDDLYELIRQKLEECNNNDNELKKFYMLLDTLDISDYDYDV
jgi:hypothetical protein